jgi:hypothetical protein
MEYINSLIEMVTNSEYSKLFMSLGIVGVFIAIMLVRTLIKVMLIASIILLAYYFFVQGGSIPGLEELGALFGGEEK